MSYLNRFIIEEDMQFECNGVMSFSKNQFKRFHEKHLEILHLIIADVFGLKHESMLTMDSSHAFSVEFLHLLNLPEDKEIIISRIGRERLECIQKEQYQKFYKEGGQVKIHTGYLTVKIDPEWKTELYKSIGDDIEDFYNRIKMNEINLIINQTYETINDCWKKMIKSISLNNSYLDSSDSKLIVRSFHLSMLTDQEESEIHSKGKKKGNTKTFQTIYQ